MGKLYLSNYLKGPFKHNVEDQVANAINRRNPFQSSKSMIPYIQNHPVNKTLRAMQPN